MADQGGDPLILDQTVGTILHARHGEGSWKPEPIFADIFATALTLGTTGTAHAEGGEEFYNPNHEGRPIWRATLQARPAPVLGAAAASTIASRFGR